MKINYIINISDNLLIPFSILLSGALAKLNFKEN